MAVVERDLVRSLAAYRAEQGLALSCFLGLDPAEVPTARDLDGHVTSLVAGARRLAHEAGDSLDHQSSQQLLADVERVATFLDDELDRSDALGIALFVSGADGMFEEVRLPQAVADAVHVGPRFVLAPLLETLERDREVILAAVNRDRGTLWRSRGGRVTELEDRSRDGQGRHDQGGWSQARYQRSRERDAREHMRDVAEAIADAIDQGSSTLLVVSCAEEERPAFEKLLEPHVRDALIGWAEMEAHADGDALRPDAERFLAGRLDEEREKLLASWREERGQESRRAAGTWEEALAAAWDGRVDTVLVDGRTRDAWECPVCGRGSAQAGRCIADETPLEPAPDGALELVIRGTLLHDGAVRFVPEDEQLDESEGVAALLRYATPPAR